jgi:hypothetical protein
VQVPPIADEQRPFVCVVCSHNFVKKADLNKHINRTTCRDWYKNQDVAQAAE